MGTGKEMGRGRGDQDRGRSAGRASGQGTQPQSDTGAGEPLTDLQQLAQDIEGDTNRTRSQPPTRRLDGTHPMTTRQGTAPAAALTDRPAADSRLLAALDLGGGGLPEGQPEPPNGQSSRPIRVLTRGDTDPHEQHSEVDPDATTVYGDSPSQGSSGGIHPLPVPQAPVSGHFNATADGSFTAVEHPTQPWAAEHAEQWGAANAAHLQDATQFLLSSA